MSPPRPRHHLHIATSISTTTPSPPLRPLRHRPRRRRHLYHHHHRRPCRRRRPRHPRHRRLQHRHPHRRPRRRHTLAAACPSRRRPLHRTSTAPLRAPTVHSGKLTARKALGSFSSAPTSASGRASGSRSGALEHLRSCALTTKSRPGPGTRSRCAGGHANRLRAPAAPQGKPTARLALASSTHPSQAPRTGHCGHRRFGGVQRASCWVQ